VIKKIGLDEQIESLMRRVQSLELTCIKLEAERDAHMEVIKQLFSSLLEIPVYSGDLISDELTLDDKKN
jgi:hypothetical protein